MHRRAHDSCVHPWDWTLLEAIERRGAIRGGEKIWPLLGWLLDQLREARRARQIPRSAAHAEVTASWARSMTQARVDSAGSASPSGYVLRISDCISERSGCRGSRRPNPSCHC